jgi:DNA mismatch repair protein MutL
VRYQGFANCAVHLHKSTTTLPDIINLLPDNIANQIAAGEVIQRPASAVKELLENAVDAGATQIHLQIKDAGKELMLVIDNGKGMSATDARMSFERHATSKIQNINDLFSIRTMGFRGEALASIAAVAQVELKSKQHDAEMGTMIHIANSTVSLQEPVATKSGTSIAVKNLFHNVPARRSFLKSNTTEIRHIVDEFTRVAMAFPEVAFRFTNTDTDIFNLEAGNLKQRIVGLMGSTYNSKLVPVHEPTEYLTITGFVGTPDAAAKTRGAQFFFVNNRYIKSAYLNHAVSKAYHQLIAADEFPAFFLYLQVDPAKIDANVHPTKQEIKFEDERLIYAFVNSAVKAALSKHSIAPSIDFDLDAGITHLPSITQPLTEATRERVQGDYLFNSFSQKGQAHFLERSGSVQNWKEMYKAAEALPKASSYPEEPAQLDLQQDVQVLQVLSKYIVYPKSNGVLLINIRRAKQRIYYDRFLQGTNGNAVLPTQNLLHPYTMELNTADSLILADVLQDINALGYLIEPFGNNTFIVQAVPADTVESNVASELQKILEQYKYSTDLNKVGSHERLLQTMAYNKSQQGADALSNSEMQELCAQLFTSSQPEFTPGGDKIFVVLTHQELEARFK